MNRAPVRIPYDNTMVEVGLTLAKDWNHASVFDEP